MSQQVDRRPLSLLLIRVGVDDDHAAVSTIGELLRAEEANALFVGQVFGHDHGSPYRCARTGRIRPLVQTRVLRISVHRHQAFLMRRRLGRHVYAASSVPGTHSSRHP